MESKQLPYNREPQSQALIERHENFKFHLKPTFPHANFSTTCSVRKTPPSTWQSHIQTYGFEAVTFPLQRNKVGILEVVGKVCATAQVQSRRDANNERLESFDKARLKYFISLPSQTAIAVVYSSTGSNMNSYLHN